MRLSFLLTVHFFAIPALLSSCEKENPEIISKPPLGFEEVKKMGLKACMDYYLVPGCSWAVMKGDSIFESGAEGYICQGSTEPVLTRHHFQTGSLGKSFTSFLAARCVEEGLIEWESELFDIIPEWKDESREVYHQLRLCDLLSHRTRLQPLNVHKSHIDRRSGELVYEDMPNFTGTDLERRNKYCRYALGLKPVETTELNYSNAGYCLAAAMLEKVSGKTWEELALETAADLGMEIGFERPNRMDPSQPWGHLRISDQVLEAISPYEMKVYNDPMFSPAGNIHVNITDFSKYLAEFMKGLNGTDAYLSAESVSYLLEGVPGYSMGWYNQHDGETIYYHYGSEGTFFCHMMIFRELNAAIILFTNAPNVPDTQNFLNDARNLLKEHYIYDRM